MKPKYEITITPKWARADSSANDDRDVDLPDYDANAPTEDLLRVRMEAQRIAADIMKRRCELEDRLIVTLPRHEYNTIMARVRWLGQQHQDALRLTSEINTIIKERNAAATNAAKERSRTAVKREIENAVVCAAVRYRQHRTKSNGDRLDAAIDAMCEAIPWWASFRDGEVDL